MQTKNEQTKAPVLQLGRATLEAIVESVGTRPAESGGPLGGVEGGQALTHFHFDESSRTSAVTYTPNHTVLNDLFKSKWNPNGVRFRGFVHSHPGRLSRPSHGDAVYAERILAALSDLEQLWLPIAETYPDTGRFRLTAWVACRSGTGVDVLPAQIVIKEQGSPANLRWTASLPVDSPLSAVEIDDAQWLDRANSTQGSRSTLGYLGRQGAGSPVSADVFYKGATFDRVRDAYDLDTMRKSRVVAIGAGGAASWVEDLARAGLGQFVLVDPDVVTETNLATQQTYRRDLERPKVDCIAERIRDINPSAKVIALQKSLDDLSDSRVAQHCFDPFQGPKPVRTVLCGLTDDFMAQARVNRLALNLGVPSLAAQVYWQGRGAEVSFTFPGETPACHRCVLSSRYRHFLEQGGNNSVTSHGTPIFSTARLNAIKGFVLLAILHHGTDHPRWGPMLKRIGNRNLVQIRMDPDIAETLPLGSFDRVLKGADQARLFFDEVIWLPQDPESPENGYPACPDCGGTGDLRLAVGTIADTRIESNAKAGGEQ